MKIFGDYHTHTKYSHGKGTIRDNVEMARSKGLREIAITDHGLNHIMSGLKWWKILKTIIEIEDLRKEYTDISILVGVEANLIGTRGIIDIKKEQFKYFDIILCGFHKPARPYRIRDDFGMYLRAYLSFIPQGRRAIEKNTNAYIEAVKNNPIDVLTHINKAIIVDCGKIAQTCAEYGTYIELSSRHLSLDDSDYRAMLDTDVKFIINTDSHQVENIGNIIGAEEIVNRYNIPRERIVNLDDNRPIFRSQMKR